MFELRTFTAAEAEAITGVPATLLRDWRRRDCLPKPLRRARLSRKHPRYDVVELANIWAMGLLAARGIGPQLSVNYAPAIAGLIAADVVRRIEAYEGEHELTLTWAQVSPRWVDQSAWLSRNLGAIKGFSAPGAKFFIWWADGSCIVADDLRAAFGELSDDPRYAGPIIVLDVFALATTLLEKIGKPVVKVRFERTERGELLPIEYGAAVAPETNPSR
jgi:hypothetical protein